MWYRVTRHPQAFRGLMGDERTPDFWGVTFSSLIFPLLFYFLSFSGQLDYGWKDRSSTMMFFLLPEKGKKKYEHVNKGGKEQ